MRAARWMVPRWSGVALKLSKVVVMVPGIEIKNGEPMNHRFGDSLARRVAPMGEIQF